MMDAPLAWRHRPASPGCSCLTWILPSLVTSPAPYQCLFVLDPFRIPIESYLDLIRSHQCANSAWILDWIMSFQNRSPYKRSVAANNTNLSSSALLMPLPLHESTAQPVQPCIHLHNSNMIPCIRICYKHV